MSRLLFPCLLALTSAVALSGAAIPEHLDLRAKAQPLSTVLESIASQCDAGLLVHQAMQARLDDKVTLTAKQATWAEASRWLADDFRMTMRLNGRHLEIGDADKEFRDRLVSVTYDIRTLTRAMGSFPGPDLDIPEPGGVGSRLLPPIEPDSIPPINDFIELVQVHIAPGTWEISGVAIEDYNGALVVTQVPEVHKQIAEFIAHLERTSARQVVVRCHRLPAAATPLPPTLDPAAWHAMAKDLTAPTGVLLLFDEQQNSHFSGTQRLVLMDADVNQEAFDPLMSVISDGLAMDVTANVTNAGVVTTARFTATSRQAITASGVFSPNGAAQPLAPIDLIAFDQDRSRDTRVIPDGGAAIFQFAGQTVALSIEVLDFTRKP